MKKSKLLINLLLFMLCQNINAQSDIVSQLAEAVTDVTGSFMDNPYHHENTIKMHRNAKDLISSCEQLKRISKLGSMEYYQLQNMEKILKGLEHVTAGIIGNYPASVDGNDFEYLNNAFRAFHWTWSVIHDTEDIELYEYKKENFKMIIAKNKRPKLNGGDYNAVSYNCYAKSRYTKKDEVFMGKVLFGGNYQYVECCDDKTNYVPITKVTSKRGTKF